jgi:hypothetical protein
MQRGHWLRPGRRIATVESKSEDRPGDVTRLPWTGSLAFFHKGNPWKTRSTTLFSDAERAAVYQAPFSTGGMCAGSFCRDPVPDEVLARILLAAHHAPSVGFMQPWNFLVVRSPEVKQQVHDAVCQGPCRSGD